MKCRETQWQLTVTPFFQLGSHFYSEKLNLKKKKKKSTKNPKHLLPAPQSKPIPTTKSLKSPTKHTHTHPW